MSSLSEPTNVVTSGPWLGRDGFVADTAIRLDRLQHTLTRLQCDAEMTRREVSELREASDYSARLHTFEETLRNSRELKIDEMLRCIKDVKVRLDAIEGPRAEFTCLTYKSLPAINQKLNELTFFNDKIDKLRRDCTLNAALFFGSAVLLVTTLVSSLI